MAFRKIISAIFQRFFLVIFFIALIGMLGIAWWIQRSAAPESPQKTQIFQPAPTPGEDLQALEKDAQITIPASARNIYATLSRAREIDAWVRLDLPTTDLPQFIAGTRCVGPLVPVDPKKYAPEKPGEYAAVGDWWKPYEAAKLEGCSGKHDPFQQFILVDSTRADIAVVYIFSFTAGSSLPSSTP